jgi:molecular chaperone GrpE
MDSAVKQQLMERFGAYLDAVDEPAPDTPGEAPDLFSLLAEVAALKSEVKLESRQVKAALDQFRELFDQLRQANARLEQELDQRRERDQHSRHLEERGLLLELLDLRDRLRAGHEQARRYSPGWLARRGGATGFVGGMADGLEMNLDRLDGILARRGVRPLETLNQAFDPQTMHAAEIAQRADRPTGTVLGEIRQGFLHHGRLLRPAEVIVNKRDSES